MSQPLLREIVTVELPVSNLERAVAWYREVLGLRLTWQGDGAAMLAAAHGGTRIFLVQTGDTARLGFVNTGNGVRHSVVDFCTDDLASAHRVLAERGADVTAINAGARGFGLRDPDGNMLGICDIRHAD